MVTVGKRLLTDSTRLRALHRLDAASGPLAEGEGLAPAWLRAGVRGRRWRLDGTFALSAVALEVACLSLLLAAEAWRELGAPIGAPALGTRLGRNPAGAGEERSARADPRADRWHSRPVATLRSQHCSEPTSSASPLRRSSRWAAS